MSELRGGPPSASRRSLAGQVAWDLGERIVSGELKPGAVLPNEAELSIRYAISRTALREAMKVLSAKGLVESRPKIGTRVRPPDLWNRLDPDVLAWQLSVTPVEQFARDLFEVRRIIEPSAAAMAAERADEEAVARIAAAYGRMEDDVDDEDASIDADLKFHDSILAACRNELLRPLGALIETALASSIKLSRRSPGAARASLPRHAAVLKAIAAHDADRAREAMLLLLDDAIADIGRVIERRSPSGVDPPKTTADRMNPKTGAAGGPAR